MEKITISILATVLIDLLNKAIFTLRYSSKKPLSSEPRLSKFLLTSFANRSERYVKNNFAGYFHGDYRQLYTSLHLYIESQWAAGNKQRADDILGRIIFIIYAIELNSYLFFLTSFYCILHNLYIISLVLVLIGLSLRIGRMLLEDSLLFRKEIYFLSSKKRAAYKIKNAFNLLSYDPDFLAVADYNLKLYPALTREIFYLLREDGSELTLKELIQVSDILNTTN